MTQAIEVSLTKAALARLDEIQEVDPDGIITPEAFVDDAAAADSPLHRYLEWDDTEAGHQWRLHQARLILGRIRIKEVQEQRGYKNLTPRYVNLRVQSVNGGTRRGYVPVTRVVSDDDLFMQAIMDVVRYVDGFKARLRGYEGARSLVLHLEAFTEEAQQLIKGDESGKSKDR